jgi:small nuclear ribonucleoprotein (snRNP)-like protein
MLQNLSVPPLPLYTAVMVTRREILLTWYCHRVNEEVIIRLKWGQTEYKGRLVSIDSYMNIQLSGAEEWIDQQMTSVLGQVLIRYVLWILFSFCRMLGSYGARCKRPRRVLIRSADATTSYGFKAQIRTMAMRTRRWRDNVKIVSSKPNKARIWSVSIGGFGGSDQEQNECACRIPQKFTGISMGKAF